MHVMRALLIGMLIVALPLLAGADIIPISDVNENDEDGLPVLGGTVVTVLGVAVVATGTLGATTDIYIQDGTGGVNVRQTGMSSPVIALGDSVRVTGFVQHATSSGRTALFVTTTYPSTRMVVVNGGNELPAPLELTPREIWESGDELYEGIYAVVRGVSLASGYGWASCGDPPQDSYTKVADGDASCWLWFDGDTDLCGSQEPLETFEIYGVVIPDLRAVFRPGHGILPVMRSDVLSSGPGSGHVTVEPDRAYAADTLDLTFAISADAGELTQVSVTLPSEWTFSGLMSDVLLDGPAFSGAEAVSTPDSVILTGCELSTESQGTVTLVGTIAPASAGTYSFDVKTADEGSDLAYIQTQPEIGVGASAESGVVLINEIYAYSGGYDDIDRAEFIELHNPGSSAVDLTGWVLTDLDDSGACGGSNLWEFPEGTVLEAGGYVVVAKDARFSYFGGFYHVFGHYPDFELFDPYGTDQDWPDGDAPNMILVSPDDGDLTVNQEIRLIGGADGNGTLVAGAPAYEAVFLYSDQTTAFLIDAVEYRDPVYLASDPCIGSPGLGSDDDAWTPGPPPWDTSLSRKRNGEVPVDTDVSRDDFFLVVPTPGEQNPTSDESRPEVEFASGASHSLALVKFSEPVDPDEAEDCFNYVIGDGVAVLEAALSRDGRTVLLKTTDRIPGETYTLEVDGVTDVAGNAMAESFSGPIQIGATTISITELQEYDANGFCVRAGEIVNAVGLTTVPAGIFQPQYTSMYIQEPDGAGVNVFMFGPTTEPSLEGDLVFTTGEIVDYVSSSDAGATTEVEATSISVLARGFAPLEPTVLATGDIGHEDNEGLF
ncbi:MAG: lamin tail domain-containing protein, partial [Candidatus Eisenbacteria sp.]|nr:lamin tail domain-containing protein [Candidatus Eisenbacteria bacterium]